MASDKFKDAQMRGMRKISEVMEVREMLEDKEAISYLPSPLSPPALFPASGHQSVPAASSRSHLSPGLVAGVDEVGRGCLFGPVVAAAVILPDAAAAELVAAGLKDSKKLTSVGRRRFAEQIQAVAIDYKIGFARVEEIDRLNIFHGSLLAMKRAVMKLKVQPDLCLVDGKWPIPNLPIEQKTLIKGDEISPAIAAASIIAKVWRDDLIMRLALKYPEYDLVGNKGYGTPKHLQALQKYGPSRLHRRSFSPCRSF